jgi:PIN domain nuclease of toxin-antitoxin system
LPHRDPADHFLAATTLVYDLTLITVDGRLTQATWLPTRSQ